MRCFVAVDIPERLKKEIYNIQEKIAEDGIKLVEQENLHITLLFIGDIEDDKVVDIIEKLRAIKMKKFRVRISNIGFFPNDKYIRIVWLGIDGDMEKLAAVVTQKLPEFRDKRGFSAHLTIARVKSKPKELVTKVKQIGNVNIGEFVVDRFVLKKSTLMPTGPIYEDLAVFELI